MVCEGKLSIVFIWFSSAFHFVLALSKGPKKVFAFLATTSKAHPGLPHSSFTQGVTPINASQSVSRLKQRERLGQARKKSDCTDIRMPFSDSNLATSWERSTSFYPSESLEQSCPTELSVEADMFSISPIQYGSHSSHVGMKQ